MNWETVWQIALAAIVSAGGIGGILIGVVKFSANQIAERMSKKFEASISKELEKYKTELSKKEYVSKARFDAEFGIFRELSRTFFNMVRDINSLVPAGYHEVPANENDFKEYQEKCWQSASKSLQIAQETLFQNAPFISEDLYNSFSELLSLTNLQIYAYTKRFNVGYYVPPDEKNSFSSDDYKRAIEIQQKMDALNKKIRKYLSSLEVSE